MPQELPLVWVVQSELLIHCGKSLALPSGTAAQALGHFQSIFSVTRHSASASTLQVKVSLLPLRWFWGLRLRSCLLQGSFIHTPLGLEGL